MVMAQKKSHMFDAQILEEKNLNGGVCKHPPLPMFE